MKKNETALPNDISALQKMVRELQEEKSKQEGKVAQETAELERLYHQVTGQSPNEKWDLRDYAVAIYEYLDNIIALAPGHMFWLDKNNVYLGCNNSQAISVGLSSRYEIVGKTNAELSLCEQADELNNANNEVIRTGKAVVLEEPSDVKTGRRIFLSEKVPLRNKEGEIIGVLGTSRDITDQKNTIEALEKMKAELDHDGEHTKLISEKIYKLEESNKQLQQALDKTLHENAQMRAIQKIETTEFASIYQQITGQPPQQRFLLRDYALAIYEYLNKIISLAPGHIFWLDKNNVYLGCNNAQAVSLGLPTRQAIIGKTNADMIWKAQAEQLDQANTQVMESGKTLVIEEPLDLVQGHRIFLSEKVPLRDNYGQIIGLLGTAVDITEQKQAMETLELARKKAEEASWAKSEFIQNMSHDLKTPLTTIIGMSEILLMKETDLNKRERVTIILNAGKRVADIFSDILEAASTETGESNILQQEISIRDIFKGLQDIYQPQAELKNIDFLTNVSDEVPDIIINDRMRVQRVLLNLVGNALKFTSEGKIEVNAEIQNEDSKKILKLTVSDSGIGMPADKLEIIFEKFVRLTSSYSGKYSGTGLGLGIVKRYLEELGGTISVQSEEGQGSVFICKIPID